MTEENKTKQASQQDADKASKKQSARRNAAKAANAEKVAAAAEKVVAAAAKVAQAAKGEAEPKVAPAPSPAPAPQAVQVKLNAKARQYLEFLAKNKIDCFSAVVPKERPDSCVFRSYITIEGEDLPMWIEIDDSVLVMVYVRLASRAIKGKTKSDALDYFNRLNSKYKAFKYTVNGQDEPMLMSCVPFTGDDGFKPELIHAILNLIVEHLGETYADFMSLVWSK